MSHTIRFTLDGEPETTSEHQLAPNFIISEFGRKDPSSNYLIELRGNGREKISYQGKGDEPIKMHNNTRFQIISIGPTPVSDAGVIGLSAFVAGLLALGFSPAIIDAKERRVTFDYLVESGKHVGQIYKLGLEVPPDFPLTPPSGPHVNAILHPTGQGGSHPTANVNDSAFGGGWQYWSRPFPDWASSKKTVAAYMAHIFRLWDSQ